MCVYKTSSANVYINDHINHKIDRGQMDLLKLTPYVGHTFNDIKSPRDFHKSDTAISRTILLIPNR